MKNETQLEHYKKLTSYIDKNYKENINIEKVEVVLQLFLPEYKSYLFCTA